MAEFATVTIESPEDESETASSPISVSGTATAGSASIADVSVRVTGGPWVAMTLGDENAWSGSLGMATGETTVSARATDVNGLVGPESSITVTMTGNTHAGNHRLFFVGRSGPPSRFWTGNFW